VILQALYNLSDDQAEYQLRDRFSFMRFLGWSWRMNSGDFGGTARA
jgi:IS5 family transposase